jgi:hypothetical protein
MLQAGWRFIEDGGVIKHGTLRTATDGAVFFVFGVYAIDWDVVLEKLVKWLGLIGFFGHAAYTSGGLSQFCTPCPTTTQWVLHARTCRVGDLLGLW